MSALDPEDAKLITLARSARGRTGAAEGAADSALYKAGHVTNYPGVPAVSGPALLETMTQQARALGADILRERALSAMPMGKTFGVSAGKEFAEGRALLLATGVMVYRKCRVCESRRLVGVPFHAFGGGFALCTLSFANLYTLHKTPECLCLTFAAFWESCLQVGLVPTNGYYRYFFAESTAAAQIVDSQGRTRYRAQSAPVLTRQQLREAAREPVLLDADTRLQSAPIRGGRVYWVEDISKINRIRAQLSEVNAQLSEENELIQAENELKRQRAEIEEKNRLMDAMLRLVEPQLLQINRLLEDGTAQSLKHICLLGAYVKRRVNLALICEKKETVPAEELTHCIRESLTYLTQYGVACALHQEGSGSVGSRDAQMAYDFFDDCLEAALPSLSAMMVRVECGARFSVRLMLEDAAGLPDGSAYAQKGRLTIDDADGAPCATLSFDRGGDGG